MPFQITKRFKGVARLTSTHDGTPFLFNMKTVNYKNKVWSWMFPYGNPSNLSTHILFLIAEEFVHDVLKLPKNIKEATGYKHIFRNELLFKEWYKEKYPHYQKHLKY